MNRLPRVTVPALLAAFLLVLLTACGTAQKKLGNQRDITLRGYSSAVRWSEFEMAWTYVDPVYREAHPVSDLERERYKQIQVTGYEVRNVEEMPDGGFDQVVEIRLITKATQVERSIIDHQHWIFDAASKHWWLTTGLPKIFPD
jgi:hypothetical protein